ncbi:hypothetical protein [Vibrio cyclitrophicus]|uniref:hypothetical protein n=1 Tax=Vibrio cyclitrophicus TaxID=47951 RepID=UPI000C83F6AC|nr:hypothetical protein [Vibrio cyclitrophicus]PMH74905.1 hypothetical protein BCU59_19405 [Vibrio cyclitrophicus]
MQIHIETISINDKHYRPIKTIAGFTLAQEVIQVRKEFEQPYTTLSDRYTIMTRTAVIAESSNKDFSGLTKALEAFKVA